MGCTTEGITWVGFHRVLYGTEYREGQAEIDLSKCNGTYVSSSSSSSDEGDEDSGVDSDHTMELLPGVSEYVAWDTQPGVKANEDK